MCSNSDSRAVLPSRRATPSQGAEHGERSAAGRACLRAVVSYSTLRDANPLNEQGSSIR